MWSIRISAPSWTNRCSSGIPHLCSSSGRDIEHRSLVTKSRKAQHGQKPTGRQLLGFWSISIQNHFRGRHWDSHWKISTMWSVISQRITCFPSAHICSGKSGLVSDLWAELLQTINVKSSLRARLALRCKVTRPFKGYMHRWGWCGMMGHWHENSSIQSIAWSGLSGTRFLASWVE